MLNLSLIKYSQNLHGFSRKLQKFTVQVHPYHWNRLLSEGNIELIQGIFPVLKDHSLYDRNIGICLDDKLPEPESLIA